MPDGEVANAAARLHSFLLGAADGAAYLLSTWRKDGHPDHEAAGDVTARVARELGVPFGEFAIWAWHWAEPADLPQSRMQVWALSPRAHIAKREALRAFASQTNPTGRPPVLPAHLVARLLRPIEVLLV